MQVRENNDIRNSRVITRNSQESRESFRSRIASETRDSRNQIRDLNGIRGTRFFDTRINQKAEETRTAVRSNIKTPVGQIRETRFLYPLKAEKSIAANADNLPSSDLSESFNLLMKEDSASKNEELEDQTQNASPSLFNADQIEENDNYNFPFIFKNMENNFKYITGKLTYFLNEENRTALATGVACMLLLGRTNK
ncbi:uncharacterized protein LOC120349431 [Nilaparvata lugens]|uniref:uncharacterized protein LOC120349431 n=1 Tax=Nilaparvata lugens TaxID=108931 RepID=UPI00193D4D6A|nr:uncharacterized protein LOC120349431 [Nilaparvata lugens]